jgi:hypothetical protein
VHYRPKLWQYRHDTGAIATKTWVLVEVDIKQAPDRDYFSVSSISSLVIIMDMVEQWWPMHDGNQWFILHRMSKKSNIKNKTGLIQFLGIKYKLQIWLQPYHNSKIHLNYWYRYTNYVQRRNYTQFRMWHYHQKTVKVKYWYIPNRVLIFI